MKVAVVTPYYRESIDVLKRCMESVNYQTHKDVFHVMVADGFPNTFVATSTPHHIVTPPCTDVGATPRMMGCAYASAAGADALIMLDADCWLDPQHIEILLKVHAQAPEACIITYPRKVYTKDGSVYMGICKGSNGVTFNDTNCYFITRPAFSLMSSWGFQIKQWALFSDHPVWAAVSLSGMPMVRTNSVKVNYPSDYIDHYKDFGFPIPDWAIRITARDGRSVKVSYKELREQNDQR